MVIDLSAATFTQYNPFSRAPFCAKCGNVTANEKCDEVAEWQGCATDICRIRAWDLYPQCELCELCALRLCRSRSNQSVPYVPPADEYVHIERSESESDPLNAALPLSLIVSVILVIILV